MKVITTTLLLLLLLLAVVVGGGVELKEWGAHVVEHGSARAAPAAGVQPRKQEVPHGKAAG